MYYCRIDKQYCIVSKIEARISKAKNLRWHCLRNRFE